MPKKGFKLVPPSCSGMISFGQLDVLVKRALQGESRGGETEKIGQCPRRNSARVLHSWRRLASAGWRGLAEVECARYTISTISLHTIHGRPLMRKGRLAKRKRSITRN